MSKKILVSSEYIFPHEEIDQEKMKKLMTEIKKSQVLLKMPVVFKSGNRKYIILDGHHRVEALKKIGIRYIPCLSVEINEINLSFWIHQINDSELLWDSLKNLPELRILNHEVEKTALFKIEDKGIRYWVYSDKEDSETLNFFVKSYVKLGCYKKVKKTYNTKSTYVIFNQINFEQIINNKDGLYPISSTRFILLNTEPIDTATPLINLYRK